MTVLTVAPAARAALVAQLRAHIPHPVATVHQGRPVVAPSGPNVVFVDGTRSVIEWRALGRHRRDENLEITVVCETFHGGTSNEQAEAQAWDLADRVGQAVTADVTLAGTVRNAICSGVEHEQAPTDQGHLHRVTVRVTADAHLDT